MSLSWTTTRHPRAGDPCPTGSRLSHRRRTRWSRGAGSYEGEPPSLLILDLVMPKVDGFEVLRRMRQEGQAVPVVVLTGKDLSRQEEQELSEAFARIVRKGGLAMADLVARPTAGRRAARAAEGEDASHPLCGDSAQNRDIVRRYLEPSSTSSRRRTVSTASNAQRATPPIWCSWIFLYRVSMVGGNPTYQVGLPGFGTCPWLHSQRGQPPKIASARKMLECAGLFDETRGKESFSLQPFAASPGAGRSWISNVGRRSSPSTTILYNWTFVSGLTLEGFEVATHEGPIGSPTWCALSSPTSSCWISTFRACGATGSSS